MLQRNVAQLNTHWFLEGEVQNLWSSEFNEQITNIGDVHFGQRTGCWGIAQDFHHREKRISQKFLVHPAHQKNNTKQKHANK